MSKGEASVTASPTQRRVSFLLSAVIALAPVADAEGAPPEYSGASRPPRIAPDYRGVVIPPNIAPLNFRIGEPGSRYEVEISGRRGEPIRIVSDEPQVRIPLGEWQELLEAHRGETLHTHVRVRRADGTWQAFETIQNAVAEDEIDRFLVYRLLKPLYNKYVSMAIYQRDLETFEETAVLRNRDAGNACINCHTFLANRPDAMALQTRGGHGLTMLLARDGEVVAVDTRTELNRSPAAYTTWHPGGQMVAFSMNKLSLLYHTHPAMETREVFDAASDLAVYWLATNTLTTTPDISDPARAETWPRWSPDGRSLYFSSAPVMPIERFAEVRYDLMRIGYDPRANTWGERELVVASEAVAGSITQPRISPDGHLLVFTVSDHGSFPIFSPSADLHVLSLARGRHRRLEINSGQADTWHSWSTNSRWLVFSSKRRDGLFARPYISYVDTAGQFHKPFILPQEDAEFYDSFIETYNLPELIQEPVRVEPRELAQAIFAPSELRSARLAPGAVVGRRDTSTGASGPYSPGSRR